MGQSKKKNIPIRGLVLAGGKSTRMGEDKGLLVYHQKPQRLHCFELLSELELESVHISCRKDQVKELNAYAPIPDQEGRAGPMFILNHVLQLFPDSAWLLLPCDVPLMDADTLTYLITHRNTSKIATTFRSPTEWKPEPLLAIWEPAALPLIQEAIVAGNYSPRKLLMEYEPELIEAPQEEALWNANSPEDKERIKDFIEEG